MRLCIVGCQDERLNRFHYGECLRYGAVNNTHMITLGNAVLDLVCPCYRAVKEYLLDKIGIAVIHHQAERVILYNHLDCRYYVKKGFVFDSTEEEKQCLARHLDKAACAIRKKFPGYDFEIDRYLVIPEGEDSWRAESVVQEGEFEAMQASRMLSRAT